MKPHGPRATHIFFPANIAFVVYGPRSHASSHDLGRVCGRCRTQWFGEIKGRQLHKRSAL